MSEALAHDVAAIAVLTGRGLFAIVVLLAIGMCFYWCFRLAIALVAWSIERRDG